MRRQAGQLGVILLQLAAAAWVCAQPPYHYETFSFDVPPRYVVGVKYRAGDTRAAVPLGGIGTGTVYFTSRGTFEGNALTNTYRPLPGPMAGCFFAIRCEAGGRTVARLLQAEATETWPAVESLTYLGHFPVVDIEYLDRALPVGVQLRAMSPFVPGDSRESATPGAMFRFSLANDGETTARATIAFCWTAPEPRGGQGGRSQGNVDGFLTWSLGPLGPHKSTSLTVVYGLADSPAAAAKRIRVLRALGALSPRGASFRSQVGVQGDPIWLKNDATDFAVDRYGAFNWEDKRRQALTARSGGCLSQHGFAIQYNDGAVKRAWTPIVGGRRLANLVLVEPTRAAQPEGRCAVTRLKTSDGKINVGLITSMGDGPFALLTIVLTNASDDAVRDVRVSFYGNFEADHTESNDVGRLDPELGAFLTVDPKTGSTAFLAGPDRPVAGWSGTWGGTIRRMAEGRSLAIERWKESARLESRKLTSRAGRATWHWVVREDRRDRAGCTIGVCEEPGVIASSVERCDPKAGHRRFWESFAGSARRKQAADQAGADAMAVAATVNLRPGERRDVRFVLAWYYPDARDSGGKFVGHMYSNWFDSSLAVARHLAWNWDDLVRRTGRWQEKVYRAAIPDWLKERLVNSLYSMARNTSWLKDGRYTHSESFRGCPITETIVCRFYGSIPLAMFFPDLEKNTMRQFMRHQREDGAIPFAFGRPEYWDRPYYETQQSLDSAEFVLMAWRDVHWWNDRQWADEVYPAVKRAIRFAQTLDLDGDGVINDDVSMQYYDCWKFTGTSTYVGTIWLAALRAAERLARMEGDAEFAAECRRWFDRARSSIESDLWTGRYYRLYNDRRSGRRSDTSLGNQLVGQWYAYLGGLGEILPRDHILSALRYVAEKNGAASRFGLVNGVRPDGSRDTTGRNRHSDSITIGETWCYAATCVYAGLADLGLPVARRLAENIALRQRSPWNTTWNMDPDTGRMLWGTEYYSNMCVWDLWGALLGRRTLEPAAAAGPGSVTP